MWDKYRKQFAYATHIQYDQIVAALRGMLTPSHPEKQPSSHR